MQRIPLSLRAPRDFAPLRAILPLVLSVAIISAGNGLLTTKTSLQLALEGFSVGAVRAIVTGYPLGFLIGCASVRHIILRLGHGRTFQLMAVLTAMTTLIFMLSTSVFVWTPLRIINGFAMASVFTVAESWINLDSGPRNRGSLFAMYMIMSTLGLAAGQSMINLGDPRGDVLFVLAAATCLIAVLPFIIDGRLRPGGRMLSASLTGEPDQAIRLLDLLRITPIVVLAAAQTGMTNMNFGVFGPIYAAQTGHEATTAAALVTTFTIGGFVAQLPIGWLSDRIDRRLILAATGLAAASCCVATSLFGHLSTPLLFVLFFAYGATALSIYPVAVAYAGSRVEAPFMVSISSRLLLIYALGAVVSPAISNELMVRFAPDALFLFLGAAALMVGIGAVIEFLFGRREVAL